MCTLWEKCVWWQNQCFYFNILVTDFFVDYISDYGRDLPEARDVHCRQWSTPGLTLDCDSVPTAHSTLYPEFLMIFLTRSPDDNYVLCL